MAPATVASVTSAPTAKYAMCHGSPVRDEELHPDLTFAKGQLRAELVRRVRQHLREVMKSWHLTAYRLGKLTGANPSTFSKLLEAQPGEDRGIGLELLYRLSLGLGIPAQMWLSKDRLPESILGTPHARRAEPRATDGPPQRVPAQPTRIQPAARGEAHAACDSRAYSRARTVRAPQQLGAHGAGMSGPDAR